MRQSGRRIDQLKQCVKNSYFIIPNHNMLPYVKQILKEIDREDIILELLSFVNNQYHRGIQISGFVLDHSISLTEDLIINLYTVLPALPPDYYKDYRKTKIICNKNDLYFYEKINILEDIYQKLDFFNYVFFNGYMEDDNIALLYNTELTKMTYMFMQSDIYQNFNDLSLKDIINKWKTIHLDLLNRGLQHRY